MSDLQTAVTRWEPDVRTTGDVATLPERFDYVYRTWLRRQYESASEPRCLWISDLKRAWEDSPECYALMRGRTLQ